MSFYWASTAAGSTGLLVALPFIVEATTANWRTSYWFWSGFSAFSLILGIFYLPKTLYPRPPAFIDGQVIITDQYGNVTIIAAEGAPHLASEVQQDSSEKEPTPPKTYLEELVPFKYEKQGFRRCYMTYAEMAISLLNPSIFFLLILNSLLFAGLVCQSLTYSIQLELPPWHFSPAAVGTAQAGPFFGALIAHALCGATVDRISAILTRRNNEPEHILPNFIETWPSTTGSAFISAWAYISCGFIAISAMTGMWIGEASPHYGGAGLVLVHGGRNALSFAISNNFPRWIAGQGFANAYIQLGSVILGVMIVGGVPMFFFNKRIRRIWTKKVKFDLK